MKRRDLLAAMAAGLLWLPGRAAPRRRRRGVPWEFRLDGRHRWSLVSHEGASAIAAAEVVVVLEGMDARPLGDLDNVRRFELAPPSGGSSGWQVIGSVAGVEVTADFLGGPTPVIRVTARGLAAERSLLEIRFLDSRTARVAGLAGGARPVDSPRQQRLWINGYESSSDCRVVAGDGTVEATSHWQLALLPPDPGTAGHPFARGLALSFGVEDSGAGRFEVANGIVASSVIGERAVGMDLAPVSASLAIVPDVDPLGALGRLAAVAPLRRKVPSGWSSRHVVPAGATEAEVLANLDAAGRRFDARSLGVLQIDDGFQRAVGDWDANDRFPHGHRWLTDRIHAAGFQAGLWLAPFAVAERSGIPTAHPEWLLTTPEGEPLVVASREGWGGRIYAVDAGQAVVQDFLRELARHVVTNWGYDYLRLDALHLGVAGTRRGHSVSAAEACRAGLRALREGASRAFLLGCDAPLQHAVGLVDAMRTAPDVDSVFSRFVPAARASLLRAHLNGTAWINDLDAVLVGEPLTEDEARTWATVVALSGGMALASEDLDRLPDERRTILKRIMPVAPVHGRALDVAVSDWTVSQQVGAPAWLLAPVSDDWWMLAAVNWDDVAQPLDLSLSAHGIRGPLAAYDVWRGVRRDDVRGPLEISLPPHATTLLSLRRPRRGPFVLGSTRHLVQGIVDLADERWDARQRTLSARAVLLDDRPYEVTIALPPGFHPGEARCEPDAEITVAAAERGAARLRLPRPPGPELSWSVQF